jgi:hypothetical protein
MARTRAARKPLSQRSLIWIEGTLCGLMAAVATPMALLVAGLLLPGLAALALDRSTGKPIARAMLLLGAAAAVAPTRDLWEVGMTMAASMQLLTDPVTLGLAWGGGLCGWGIAEVAPVIAGLALDTQSVARASVLRKMRAVLEDEWGLEPRADQDVSAQS